MKNRRGVGAFGGVAIALVAVVVIFFVSYIGLAWLGTQFNFERIIQPPTEGAHIEDVVESEIAKTISKPLRFIFGDVSLFLLDSTGNISAIVITIAIWLLIFFTFGDVLQSFSTFGPMTSWAAAFLLTVIAANLKVMIAFSAFFLNLFIGFGIFAVLSALVGAFVFFFLVNWGIQGLAPTIMARKAMVEAHKVSAKTSAETYQAASVIKALTDMGKSFSGK